MTDYSELKRLAEAAPEGPWFGPEYAPGTSYVFGVDLGTLLHYESIDTEQDACLRYVAAANPAAVLELIAENERLATKVEQVKSRSVSLDHSPNGVIPNALDAWGRVVPQHLPYDFSGNPGASAIQYCNGWNDAGGYWKAHCVDIQVECGELKAENDRLHKLISWQGDANNEVTISAGQLMKHMDERDQLKAENEALRKDAERWRHLRKCTHPSGQPLISDAEERTIDLDIRDGIYG